MKVLRVYRVLAELSQYQVANRANMSQSKYSAIERGDSEPSPTDKRRIADALDLPVEILSGDSRIERFILQDENGQEIMESGQIFSRFRLQSIKAAK